MENSSRYQDFKPWMVLLIAFAQPRLLVAAFYFVMFLVYMMRFLSDTDKINQGQRA